MNVGGPQIEYGVRSAECGINCGTDCGVAAGGGDADVIDERIKPDVGDVCGIEGNRDAPVQTIGGAGDAEVFEGVVLEKAEDFVAAIIGLDEMRIRLDVTDEPFLLVLEFEIIIFLDQFGHFAVLGGKRAVRQAVLVGEKSFLFRRVITAILALVEKAAGIELGKNGLDGFLVARLGGADKIIVGKREFFDQRFPNRRQVHRNKPGAFCPGQCRLAGLFGRAHPLRSEKTLHSPGCAARAITSATIFS